MRLQKFLAQAGRVLAPERRGADRAGEVQVNGVAVTTLGTSVEREGSRRGRRPRVVAETPIYRLLLKPRACLATLAKSGATARRWRAIVRDAEPGWKVVAPLDFPAEGVVLLTTDGELAEAMSRRRGKVPMTYHLKLQGLVGDDEIERLRRAGAGRGARCRPVTVDTLATTGKNTWIEMVVAETRPRVLKAAGELIRQSLLKISRVRLGGLSFEGLTMGELARSDQGRGRRPAQRAGLA